MTILLVKFAASLVTLLNRLRCPPNMEQSIKALLSTQVTMR